MSRIEGKSALITGGDRGIGRAIAEAMLSLGASVFICGSSRQGIDVAIGRGGPRIDGAVCNVRNYRDMQALLRKAVRFLGA